jgi:hypothetical protein
VDVPQQVVDAVTPDDAFERIVLPAPTVDRVQGGEPTPRRVTKL